MSNINDKISHNLKQGIKMDTLFFDYSLEKHDGDDIFIVTLYVNNKILFAEFQDVIFNIMAFKQSVKKSGNYALFTCGCGEEGCAGIWETPYVTIEEKTIKWQIFEPEEKTFVFDKEYMIKTLNHLKQSILNEYPNTNWDDVEFTPCVSMSRFLFE